MKNIFGEEIDDEYSSKSPVVKRHRRSGYRTADLVFNKFNILKNLEFTDDSIPVPVVKPFTSVRVPNAVVAFSKCRRENDHTKMVHFYEADINFARVIHAPASYVDVLKRFDAVIGPDFSQKIGYERFVCMQNSWWNKALMAYFQSMGVRIIPNVAWSDTYSLTYAFKGLPKHSVIAINCTGIVGCHASKYLWRKGYEEALRVLEPSLIVRYGDIMPGEDTSISVYYENTNLLHLRNGR